MIKIDNKCMYTNDSKKLLMINYVIIVQGTNKK